VCGGCWWVWGGHKTDTSRTPWPARAALIKCSAERRSSWSCSSKRSAGDGAPGVQRVGKRCEEPDGACLPGLCRLQLAERDGALDEDRLLADVVPAQTESLARARARVGVGEDCDERRVCLAVVVEHRGDGLRPEIASNGDLVAMSGALRRDEDLKRIPALRRILELEADPAGLVAPSPTPGLRPGAALDGELSHPERSRPGVSR
jgi:hypothetical protein